MNRIVRLPPVGLAFLLPVLGSGCAPLDRPMATDHAPAPRACFNASRVRAFRMDDDETVLLDVGRGQHFAIRSLGHCVGLDSALQIGVRSEALGLERLCSGDFARLHISGPTAPPVPCRAQVIGPVTDAPSDRQAP